MYVVTFSFYHIILLKQIIITSLNVSQTVLLDRNILEQEFVQDLSTIQ